jgi:hypothetical protein
MANSFLMMEIPYSVIIFAYFKFHFIIKTFEEVHSIEVLQLILDATMAERFYHIISDCCYFIKLKLNCANRSNRAIFIISDGLDLNFHYYEDWKTDILSNKNDSLEFYFICPDGLDDSDYQVIHSMWNSFFEGIFNSESLCKYLSIISEEIVIQPKKFFSF